VFNEGKLQQIDTPEKLYLRPVRSFVANFIGENNLITVTVKEIGADKVSVEMDDQSILISKSNMQEGITKGALATLSIRPESILVGDFPSDIGNVIKGKIEQDIFAGSEVRLIIGCGDNRITANLSDKKQFHLYERGQDVKLGFKSDDAMLFMPSKMEEE
jgi:putative spermidine/putrescine transport system ATP-binding protein